MIIRREIQKNIERRLLCNSGNSRIIIVYGARQVGKTTLVKDILNNYSGNSEYFINPLTNSLPRTARFHA